ncbi:hypothetical protein GOP47_0027179 [Adiantum capillus-veneris]|nr:hypothetical protein GOP47_0027179 [Adiantum capillus-veneris]
MGIKGEQRRVVNQSSAPVSIATALQKIPPNESLAQSAVVCHSVPMDKRDGAGLIVICARCFRLMYERTMFFKPTISKPLDHSVSREINQAFASPSPATNLQNLDTGQNEGYGLKSSVAELVQDEAFPATVCASNVLHNYHRSVLPKTASEAVALNSLVAQSLHDAAVPCGGCVTCNFQNNVLQKPFPTQPCNASVPPSNNYIFQPAYMNSRQNFDLPMPHVNIMAEVGDVAVPCVHDTWEEPPDLVLMDRCNLMEQQLSEQGTPPLIDHRTGVEGPNVGITSPTFCNQFYDENGPLIVNLPKCISIRADSHNHQVKIPSCCKNGVKVAFNTTGVALSPIEQNKPFGHHRQGAPTMNEVQEQTKVVALAENLACLAFSQGMYKTEMCNKWLRSMGQYCPYGDKCQFAHGSRELRPVLRHRRYKTILCRMVAAGEPCPYEHRCHFRHVIYPHEAEVLALKSIPKSASSTSTSNYI